MKLRKVEICGFKSFVDKTVVAVGDAVTAVVGPNGCGKSNVVDAIRWAMGEQSARSLRGKGMDDVIFAGSESRGPLSSAEVTLNFLNDDGRCHPDYADYAELAITRRLTREGQSEYLINGTACRLRDVTDLLLSAGVSPRSSLVEQGRMGMIVTARPEDRRLLIEEAAGIAKYRIHRQAATRKMEKVRQNLLRVTDVVAEMDRTLSSLKRQVAKAKRYQAYREELTGLELHVAAHRYLELLAVARRRGRELEEVERVLAEAETALEAREASIVSSRGEQADAERRLEELQALAYDRESQVQRTEGRIARLREGLAAERDKEREATSRLSGLGDQLSVKREEASRVEAERVEVSGQAATLEVELDARQRRLAEVRSERLAVEERIEAARREAMRAGAAVAAGETGLESIGRREAEAKERAEEIAKAQLETAEKRVALEARIDVLGDTVTELRDRARDLGASREERQAALEELAEELREAVSDMEGSGLQLTECRSRLASLEEIVERYENFGQGVRELMGRDEIRAEARGVVAELLDVPSDLEAAVAAVLGERLQDLVVDDVAAASRVAGLVTAESLGRAGAVPAVPRRVGLPPEVPTCEGVLGALADRVGCARGDEPLVRQLLAGVVLVQDLATAMRLWAERGGELTLVTRAGEVVHPGGRISAGREEVSLALLQTKREIRKLGSRVEVLTAEHERDVEHVTELRDTRAELQRDLETLRQNAHKGDLEVVQRLKDLSQARAELERHQIDAERLLKAAERMTETLAGCCTDRERIREEIAAATAAKARAEEAIEAEAAALEQRRTLEDEAAGAVTELRVEAAATKERLESLTSTAARLRNEVRDLESRVGRAGDEGLRAAEAQGRMGGEAFAARELLVGLVVEADRARQDLGRERTALDALRSALAETEAQLRAARSERDGHRKRAEEVRLALHEARLAIAALAERVEEGRGVSLDDVVADYHMLPPADQAQVDRIDELRHLIDRMGPVSLTAVEEYDELSARFETSSAQKEDLEQSLAHLQRAIQRLNREGRRRFRETFDLVNHHFETVFPRLFEGGRAKLLLTDESDLLETGVEIVAQPPGKKLGRMELMSGGEKAMTAVALTFALFQASPSPFCVLDEVDAPFDDANVRRYLELLREMADYSQFIMVTHSKISMAKADVLYGVTMEEPGVSKVVTVRFQEDGTMVRPAAAAA